MILFGCSVRFKSVTNDHCVRVLSTELFKFTKPLHVIPLKIVYKTKILAITIKLLTKETFSTS